MSTIRRLGMTTSASVVFALACGSAALAAPAAHVPGPPGVNAPGPLIAPELKRAPEQRQGTQKKAPSSPSTSPRPSDAELDAVTQQLITQGATGVTARIERPGKDWADAAGTRDAGAPAPVNDNTHFRVASNTKMMIATLVMQEIQRGRWTLKTTAGQAFPGLLPGHESVTLEQLLSHTSGLPDGVLAMLTPYLGSGTDAEFIAAISRHHDPRQIVDAAIAQGWAFAPGSDYLYSNAGYAALGLMLERLNGAPLSQLLQTRIFAPAKMNQTSFPTTPGLPGNSLTGTMITPDGTYSLQGFDPSTFSAAGAAVSTTKDLNAFTEALLDGRLLNPALVEDMLTPRSEKQLSYGLGVYRVPDPCTPAGAPQQYLYGHDGAAFGTFSIAWASRDGKRQVSVGLSGRHYTDATGAQPYNLGAAAMTMARATC